MIFVNPAAKQRAPSYVNRHLGPVPVSVVTTLGNDKWATQITNQTAGSGEAFDENAYEIAARAAEMGQAKRYEARLRKAIKEAQLA